MKLTGQWVTRYCGTNSGTLVIEIDELRRNYYGTAIAWDDNVNMPSALTYFETSSLSPFHKLSGLQLTPLNRNGDVISRQALLELEKQTRSKFPAKADVELELRAGQLHVRWRTEVGTFGAGVAVLSKTRSGAKSDIVPHKIKTWDGFKKFVASLDRKKFIFRGQENSQWRLRTSFYRTKRANLNRYQVQDLNVEVNKVLSALLPHSLDLKDPQHFLAALHLAQHHGYPTPLLDWTWSPYVAAFFAYRNIAGQASNRGGTVRIFKFDSEAWNRLPRADKMFPFQPHVTVLDPLAIGNSRTIPQQAISMFSNIDDIEGYVQDLEKASGYRYLEVFDLPIRNRDTVMHELALMGITAGSLFPGLDGAFEALRERNFGP